VYNYFNNIIPFNFNYLFVTVNCFNKHLNNYFIKVKKILTLIDLLSSLKSNQEYLALVLILLFNKKSLFNFSKKYYSYYHFSFEKKNFMYYIQQMKYQIVHNVKNFSKG
jgi:hypothetical protein